MSYKDPINKATDNTRILIASMVENAKSGHPGGAMGAAEFINILYSEFIIYDPDDPTWVNRDRFFSRSWTYVPHVILGSVFY